MTLGSCYYRRTILWHPALGMSGAGVFLAEWKAVEQGFTIARGGLSAVQRRFETGTSLPAALEARAKDASEGCELPGELGLGGRPGWREGWRLGGEAEVRHAA